MPDRRALLSTAATGVLVVSAGCLRKNPDASEAVSAYRLGHSHYRDAEGTAPSTSETTDGEEAPQFREAASLFQQARRTFTEARALAQYDEPKRIARAAAQKSALKSMEMEHRANGEPRKAERDLATAENHRLAQVSEFEGVVDDSYVSL